MPGKLCYTKNRGTCIPRFSLHFSCCKTLFFNSSILLLSEAIGLAGGDMLKKNFGF